MAVTKRSNKLDENPGDISEALVPKRYQNIPSGSNDSKPSLPKRIADSASSLARDTLSSQSAASETLAAILQAQEKGGSTSSHSSAAGPSFDFSRTLLSSERVSGNAAAFQNGLGESFRSLNTERSSFLPESQTWNPFVDPLSVPRSDTAPGTDLNIPRESPWDGKIESNNTALISNSNDTIAAPWTRSLSHKTTSPNVEQAERADGSEVFKLLSSHSLTTLVDLPLTTQPVTKSSMDSRSTWDTHGCRLEPSYPPSQKAANDASSSLHNLSEAGKEGACSESDASAIEKSRHQADKLAKPYDAVASALAQLQYLEDVWNPAYGDKLPVDDQIARTASDDAQSVKSAIEKGETPDKKAVRRLELALGHLEKDPSAGVEEKPKSMYAVRDLHDFLLRGSSSFGREG